MQALVAPIVAAAGGTGVIAAALPAISAVALKKPIRRADRRADKGRLFFWGRLVILVILRIRK